MHEALQEARDERNLTNAELARMLRVSESYISKIMSGVRQARRTLMPELCRVLGLPEPQAAKPVVKRRKSA